MVMKGMAKDPRRVKEALDASFGISGYGFSASLKKSIETNNEIPLPQNLNDASILTAFFARMHSTSPIVVIDEFDQMSSPAEQEKFANFIKTVADERVNVKFIFCGIGESVDELFKAHPSAPRYFHTVKLDRLPWEARLEIVDYAARELRLDVD
jgi:hypothetical protein